MRHKILTLEEFESSIKDNQNVSLWSCYLMGARHGIESFDFMPTQTKHTQGPLKWGIFKGTHNGHGIYWNGSYNIEGVGKLDTIAKAKAAIDGLMATRLAREHDEKIAKIQAGAIAAERIDETVLIHLPTGAVTMTIREFRQRVFDLEDCHGEIVLL